LPAQLLGMESHVPFLIRQDPPGYLCRQGLTDAVAQRPVIAERDALAPLRLALAARFARRRAAGRGPAHRYSRRCYRSTASLPPSRNQEALGWYP